MLSRLCYCFEVEVLAFATPAPPIGSRLRGIWAGPNLFVSFVFQIGIGLGRISVIVQVALYARARRSSLDSLDFSRLPARGANTPPPDAKDHRVLQTSSQ